MSDYAVGLTRDAHQLVSEIAEAYGITKCKVVSFALGELARKPRLHDLLTWERERIDAEKQRARRRSA